MRIAIAQLNPTVGDLYGNMQVMHAYTEAAAEQEVDLVVFPAMTLTGAPVRGLVAQPAFVAEARAALEGLAADIAVPSLMTAPVVVQDEGGEAVAVMTELVIATPGGVQSVTIPEMDGDQMPVIEAEGLKIGVLVANHFAEDAVIEGVDVLLELCADCYGEPESAPVAWGLTKRMAAVAKSSGAWYARANLHGGADTLVFSGNSCVITPEGGLLAYAEVDTDELLVFDTTHTDAELENPEEGKLNPDEYNWRGLVSATRDYVEKNGFADVVVGVSGGIDSAVVATLAVDALEAEHVHAVIMPGPFTREESVEDARELASNLGIDVVEVAIDEPFACLKNVLAEPCGGEVAGIAAENLQARIRMMYLMTLSNTNNWLVLNTGNKSEAAMGFSTLYGDTCGAFAPIGDMYKSDVYDLAKWRAAHGDSIPERCMTKAPSAELYEGATDQDRLPDYAELDDLLFDYVESGMPAFALADPSEGGHDAALVNDVLGKVAANEYKRRLEPLAPNIDGTSFASRDWPVTCAWRDEVE